MKSFYLESLDLHILAQCEYCFDIGCSVFYIFEQAISAQDKRLTGGGFRNYRHWLGWCDSS